MKAKEVYEKAVKNQWNIIQTRIKEAIKAGNIFIYYFDELAKENEQKLITDGFKLSDVKSGIRIDFKGDK